MVLKIDVTKKEKRVEFYESLIEECHLKNNIPSRKIKILNDSTGLILFLGFVIYILLIFAIFITDLLIVSLVFLLIILIAFHANKLKKEAKNKGYLIGPDDNVTSILEEFYSREKEYWPELESYLVTQYNIELLGKPQWNKYWPMFATTISLGIIFKLIKYANEPYVEGIVIILLIAVFANFTIKTLKFMRIDQIHHLIKLSAQIKKPNKIMSRTE